MKEGRHQRDMEAQYREYMGREMAEFMLQRQLVARGHPGQRMLPGEFVAPMGAVPAVGPQPLVLSALVPGVQDSSGWYF